ncbi:MAG: hypothetical protein GPJ54_03650 [Candidatus Heimdallarchaeota archaeon]|nr:hypothetical protein [Candidatus Heimdallarchaeota archaeon]
MDRLLRLSLVLQNLGSIKGEKNFQKLIYLLQSYGDDIGYSFKWNVFGPVSFQLENDIEEAINMGFIEKLGGEVPVYNSNVDSQKSHFWKERSANISMSDKLMVKIRDVGQLLEHSQKYPNQIEILASIDYLQKNEGLSIKEAKKNFKSMVGERFTQSEINASIELLDIL